MKLPKTFCRVSWLASLVFPLMIMAGCGRSLETTDTPPDASSGNPNGTVTFAAASYSITPGADNVVVTVNRTGSTAASVAYATSAGTAISTTDYTHTSGTLNWLANDTAAKNISVPISATSTGGKSFTLVLSAASGATLTAPSTTTINIATAPVASPWSAEVWSAAHSSPASFVAAQSKSPPIVASNGAVYYARMNAWNAGTGGFRYQRTWANNERDWGVTSTHMNDGQVKSYSSVVRGWAWGEGFNGINNSGLGIQISALTKARMRWAFLAPNDYGGAVGANATNRVNVLWDTYFHTSSNPGPNDLPHTSVMINQYDVDGDGYYGGLAQQGTTVTLGGRQWRMYVFQSSWASGNTIELFPGPFPDYLVFGTKDLTVDYRAVILDLVARGLIPASDYLTSIQAGYEVIAGGTFQTTIFWTALQNEVDGMAPPPTADPTVTLSANPTTVTSGQGSTLNWSSTNAASCVASGAWSGPKGSSGTQTTGALTTSSTYTLMCTGTNGVPASATTTVTVSGAPNPAPTVTLTANPTSIASGASSTLTWSSTNATACTATGNWSGAKATSGSQSTGVLTANSTFTLSCTGAGGTTSTSAAVTVSGTPQPGNCGGTSENVAWVYYNAMSPKWPYEYSFGGVVADYADTTGVPLSAPTDIKITGPAYAGWQPASENYEFDISGCNYLTFALKPTVANQKWSSAFLYVGDIPTGVVLDITTLGNYGPTNPAVGVWNVYKIPLATYFPGGVVPQTIYKFFIQDTVQVPGGTNTYYIDNVGFTGN